MPGNQNKTRTNGLPLFIESHSTTLRNGKIWIRNKNKDESYKIV